MAGKVRIVDTTLRDGIQSLWANRVPAASLLPVVELLDRAGFDSIECLASNVIDASVRYLKENPWERLRLMRGRLRRTQLGTVLGTVFSVSRRGILPDDLLALYVQRCIANGVNRFFSVDGLGDVRNLEVSVGTAKAAGAFVWGGISFSISPVHTDAFFTRMVGELRALGVDAITLKDPSGLLTPERVRTLVPALRAAAGATPVYCHSHCNTGLGPASNLEAVEQGAVGMWTACTPLANGSSLPATESMVRNLRRAGYEVDVDLEAVGAASELLREVARRHGKPLGRPAEYDPFHYRHQIPGGVISHYRAHLAELGIEDRLEQILETIPAVREDLGWTPMVTPYSQIIANQAAMNVLYGPYAVVLDEVEDLLLGRYGHTPAPPNADLLDRVCGKDKQPTSVRAGLLKPPAVEEVRRNLGPFDSDDDLLLAAFFMPEVLQKMQAAGPIRLDGTRPTSSLVDLVRDVARGGVRHFAFVRGTTVVSATKPRRAGGEAAS